MLKFYWYSNCSTCRKAKKALDDAGIAYKEIDITTNPPKQSDFKKWLKSGEAELKSFFNTSGQEYRKAGGKDLLANNSEADLLKMLASNGRLVKRPIITDGEKVTIGFRDAEAVLKVWK